MPLYEYVCDQTGEVIELRRSMAEADAPVEDPAGKGRTFTRRMSAFAAHGSARSDSTPLPTMGCPCGDPSGPCNAG
jgi:putative FmdB family regulatory protein